MSKGGLWSFDASLRGLGPEHLADPEYIATIYGEDRNQLVVLRQAGQASLQTVPAEDWASQLVTADSEISDLYNETPEEEL